MWFKKAEKTDTKYIGNFLHNKQDKFLQKFDKTSSAKHIGNFLYNKQDKLLHKLAKKAVQNI